MRVFIVAILSFIYISASANDSIQVWLDHYNQALVCQQFGAAEKSIDKIISQWKQENTAIDGTYITYLFYKIIATCSNQKFRESEEILYEVENNWELTGWSKDSDMYALLLLYKSFIFEDKGANTDEVLDILLNSLAIDAKINGRRNVQNIPTLMRIALLYGKKGDYITSLRYKEEAISVSRDFCKPDDKNLSVYLVELSDSYSAIGDFKNALNAAQEANYIIKNNYYNDKALYARSLLSLALCYSELNDYSQAIAICKNAVEISKEGNYNTVLRSSYDGLARIYFAMGDYQMALHFSLKSLELSESLGEYGSGAYITILNNLSICYNSLAEYEKAKSLQEKSIALSQKLYGTSSPNYALVLSNIASTHISMGDFSEALDLLEQAYNIQETAKDYVGCINSLRGIASAYDELGQYPKAIKYNKDAMNLCEKVMGKDNPEYARCLSGIARIYDSCGDTERAIEYEQQSSNIRGKLLGNTHPDYAESIAHLASYYYSLRNYEKAIEYSEQSLEITELVYGTDHPNYAISLGNLSLYLACAGQIERAIQLREKAMLINRQYFGEQSLYYAIDLENLANYLSALGKYERATSYYLSALKSFETIVGRNHPHYIQALDNLSSSLESQKKYVEALKYRGESIIKRRMEASLILTDMTAEGRERFWAKVKDKFLVVYPRLYYYCSLTECSQLYDVILFSKGILLNSNIQLSKLIAESEDSALIKDFKELRRNNVIINKIYLSQLHSPYMNFIDSLQNVVEAQEEHIISRVKEYGDFTNNMNIRWEAIRDNLSREDICIEFLRIPINNDSVMYVALALRSDYENPKMIPLFEEKQLKQVSDTIYYQCKEMTDLIWKPLLHELDGIKNIYFAPSGILYNIGIEFLPGMEEYKINRLSSTRELITKKETKTGNRAVLYGGLDYYAEIDTLNRRQTTQGFAFAEHANVRSMNIRGGKEFLPHTMNEIKQIGSELNNAKWKCILDTLSIGTEDSFKSLSGKGIKTLHIATHGFYYTPEEADNIGYDFLMMNNNMVSSEDKSLSRSGLLMAGANHILEGEDLPENVEDGILTAKEIADVDLRGLDLVVLSACQTGLGDISQGEGVFGLQRGFKKAGAKSILMSLWEVDDKATQIFMVQFYRNLLSGKSKRQSLSEAQSDLRKYGNGKYNDPKYWAAFILLDGLD